MRKVPELRFAGFDGEWEENTMLDFGRSLGGSSIESEFNDSGDYCVISIGSYGMNNKYIDQGLRVSLNDKTKSKLLSKDDLTMVLNDKTSSGNIIGRVLLIENDDKYVFNQRTQKIKPNKDLFNSLFLYTFLNADKNRKKIQKLVQGNTQIYVNWSTVENIKYITPKKNEQRKIGDLFKKIDDLIEIQENKVSKMEDFKKSMVQKMFPKKGELVPELRFDGFNREWEKEKLNNITSKFDNLRIPIKESLRTNGPYPYHGATGIQDYVDDYIFDGEYILIAEDGAGDINNYPLQRVSGRFWVNNHAHVIQAKDGNSNNFIFYSLSQIKFGQYLVGGTRKKLNSSSMDDILLLLPSKEEQEKIGQFFKNLDSQIENEEKLLDSYKMMKKSLLQKMFV